MTVLKVAVLTTATVLAHAVVVLLHAWAHLVLGVNMSPFQIVFIVLVIMLAPIVAAVLMWTPYRRAGALIFAVSMFGALVFGAFHHFLDPGIDNISKVPTDDWGALFRLTAVLLAIIEGWGSIVGWWSIRLIPRANVQA